MRWPLVFVKFGMFAYRFERFVGMHRHSRPSAHTVFIGWDWRGCIPTHAFFAFIEGESSANIEARRELPQESSASFLTVQIEIVVGDEQPS